MAESAAPSDSGTEIHKLVIFMARRPDVSAEAFRDYYESTHARIGEEIAAKVGVCRYFRRYVERLPGTAEAEAAPFPYDVITEVWFNNADDFRKVTGSVPAGTLPAGVAEDEERFLDRSATRFITVTEYVSDLAR